MKRIANTFQRHRMVLVFGAGACLLLLAASAATGLTLIPIVTAEVDSPPTSAASARLVYVNQTAGTPNSFVVFITNGSFTTTDNDFVFMVTAR